MGSTTSGFGSESNDIGKKPIPGASTDKTAASRLLEASRFGAPEQGSGGAGGTSRVSSFTENILRGDKSAIPKAETVSVGPQTVTRATVTSDLVSGNQVQAKVAQVDLQYWNTAQTDTHAKQDAGGSAASSGSGSVFSSFESLDVNASNRSTAARSENNIVSNPAGTRTENNVVANPVGPRTETNVVASTAPGQETPGSIFKQDIPSTPSAKPSRVETVDVKGDRSATQSVTARVDGVVPPVVTPRNDTVAARVVPSNDGTVPSTTSRLDNASVNTVTPRVDVAQPTASRNDNGTIAPTASPFSTRSTFVDLVSPEVNARRSDNPPPVVRDVVSGATSAVGRTNDAVVVAPSNTAQTTRSENLAPITAVPRSETSLSAPAMRTDTTIDSTRLDATNPQPAKPDSTSSRSAVVLAMMPGQTEIVNARRSTDANTVSAANLPQSRPDTTDVSLPSRTTSDRNPASPAVPGDRSATVPPSSVTDRSTAPATSPADRPLTGPATSPADRTLNAPATNSTDKPLTAPVVLSSDRSPASSPTANDRLPGASATTTGDRSQTSPTSTPFERSTTLPATNSSDRSSTSTPTNILDRNSSPTSSEKNATILPGDKSPTTAPGDRILTPGPSSTTDKSVSNGLTSTTDGGLGNKAGQPVTNSPSDLAPGARATDSRGTLPGATDRSTSDPRTADQLGRDAKSSEQNRPSDPASRTVDGTRPSLDAKPGDSTRPSLDAKPGDSTRPSLDAKPGDSTRPSLDSKPGDSNRPSLDSKPGDSTRPSNDATRPEGGRNYEGVARGDTRGNDPAFSKLDSRNTDLAANKIEPNKGSDAAPNRVNEPFQRNPEGQRGDIRPSDLRGTENRSSENRIGEYRNAEFRGQENRPGDARNAETRNAENKPGGTPPIDRLPDNANPTENARGPHGHRWHEGMRNTDQSRNPDLGVQKNLEPNTPNRNWDAANSRAQDLSNNNPTNRQEQINRQDANARPPESVRNQNETARSDRTDIRNETAANRTDSAANRADSAANRVDAASNRIDSASNRIDAAANRNNDIAPAKNETTSHRGNDGSANRGADAPAPLVRPQDTPIRSSETRPDNVRATDTSKQADTPKPDPSTPQTTNRPADVIPNRIDIAGPRGAENIDSRRVEPASDRVNQVVHTGRSQPMPIPDLVATQKEADAIRQILNELKQNQNLSSSEVLELPSFKEALRLLDSMRHKDPDGERDQKQNFPTQLVEAMRLSEFLKVLDKASEQEQRKLHKQQWAERSLSQQHRVRYLVKNGDTLDSIAVEILGDKRFVPLLITINRAEIIFTAISGKTEAIVYEGQYLWIPTPNEVSIHRTHYFAPNAAAVRGEPIAPEAETPIRVEELEAPTTVREFAARPQTFTAPPVVKSDGAVNTPMAMVLYRLRFAGNRNSVNLDEVKQEEQAPQRRQHKVRLGETLQSIAIHDPAIKDVNMWMLICRLNDLDVSVDVVGRPRAQLSKGDVIWLPTAEEIEEFKVINRLMQIAQLAGKELDANISERFAPVQKSPSSTELQQDAPKGQCRIDRKMVIEKIVDHCRMILTDNPDKSYGIKLQRETVDGKWMTVAAYECTEGKTLRYTYKIDGQKNCLEVGLPAAVSREMALEDFQRNWRFYYNRYTSVKTDTLELNFSEQHRTQS